MLQPPGTTELNAVALPHCRNRNVSATSPAPMPSGAQTLETLALGDHEIEDDGDQNSGTILNTRRR